MTDITEDGRYFSGYDHQVHSSEGHDFYVDDGLWDTFRSLASAADTARCGPAAGHGSFLHPHVPAERMDALLSLSRGRAGGDDRASCGRSSSSILYEKGYRDFDVEEAYEGMRKKCDRGHDASVEPRSADTTRPSLFR